MKKTTDEDIQIQKDGRMRSEYHNPIERFPEKVDQLLNALNSVCYEQWREKSSLRFLFLDLCQSIQGQTQIQDTVVEKRILHIHI